jgi:hypothetical protein
MYESWKFLSVEVMVNGGSVKIQQVQGDVNELATEEDHTFHGFKHVTRWGRACANNVATRRAPAL